MNYSCSTCRDERKIYYPIDSDNSVVGWEHCPDCVETCPECEGDGRSNYRGAVDLCDVCLGTGTATHKVNGNSIQQRA